MTLPPPLRMPHAEFDDDERRIDGIMLGEDLVRLMTGQAVSLPAARAIAEVFSGYRLNDAADGILGLGVLAKKGFVVIPRIPLEAHRKPVEPSEGGE